jgi:UDP-galactopyranose mutase
MVSLEESILQFQNQYLLQYLNNHTQVMKTMDKVLKVEAGPLFHLPA